MNIGTTDENVYEAEHATEELNTQPQNINTLTGIHETRDEEEDMEEDMGEDTTAGIEEGIEQHHENITSKDNSPALNSSKKVIPTISSPLNDENYKKTYNIEQKPYHKHPNQSVNSINSVDNVDSVNPLQQVDENQRELIKKQMSQDKENKQIEEMELTVLQSIALFFRSFFGDEDKIEREYKTKNYKQAVSDGTIDKINVLEGEIDNYIHAVFDNLRKKQEQQTLMQKITQQVRAKTQKNKRQYTKDTNPITSLDDVNKVNSRNLN